MRVVDSGCYILGPEAVAFEKGLASNIGVAEAVGVASGTDALVLALLAPELSLATKSLRFHIRPAPRWPQFA